MHPTPSPCPGSSRGGAGAGAYAPSREDSSLMSDVQKIKKDPRGRQWCPPEDTPNFKILYISQCPRGRRGDIRQHPGEGLQAAPCHPASSAILLAQTHRTTGTHCHRRCCRPPCSPGDWLGHPSVHGAPSPRPHPPSVVVRLLLLRFTKPLEEGCDRFKGNALALLLSGVLATLPAVEGILFHHILVIQRIKEHPKQVCKQAGQQLRSAAHNHPTHSQAPLLKIKALTHQSS